MSRYTHHIIGTARGWDEDGELSPERLDQLRDAYTEHLASSIVECSLSPGERAVQRYPESKDPAS